MPTEKAHLVDFRVTYSHVNVLTFKSQSILWEMKSKHFKQPYQYFIISFCLLDRKAPLILSQNLSFANGFDCELLVLCVSSCFRVKQLKYNQNQL